MKFPKFNCTILAGFLVIILFCSLFTGTNYVEGYSNNDALSTLKDIKHQGQQSIEKLLTGSNSKTEILSNLSKIEKQFTTLDTINKSITLLQGNGSSELSSVFGSNSNSNSNGNGNSNSFFGSNSNNNNDSNDNNNDNNNNNSNSNSNSNKSSDSWF